MARETERIAAGRWLELPSEILRQIFRCLTFPDTRRFASVCSHWRSIIQSETLARPPSTNTAPWLMLSEPIIGPSLPKRARRISSTARQFFNPLERRYYSIEAPDFAGSVCHASVRDWLLLSVCRRTAAERRWELFFLNPFTKARFDLPNVEADSPAPFDLATCSLPPTSSDCMVLLTKNGMEEFKTTVLKAPQQQQRYERVETLSEIDCSCKILLKKLKEYKGKDLEVIREAAAFAGEMVEHDDDLLLPPYPSRLPDSLILDESYHPHPIRNKLARNGLSGDLTPETKKGKGEE